MVSMNFSKVKTLQGSNWAILCFGGSLSPTHLILSYIFFPWLSTSSQISLIMLWWRCERFYLLSVGFFVNWSSWRDRSAQPVNSSHPPPAPSLITSPVDLSSAHFPAILWSYRLVDSFNRDYGLPCFPPQVVVWTALTGIRVCGVNGVAQLLEKLGFGARVCISKRVWSSSPSKYYSRGGFDIQSEVEYLRTEQFQNRKSKIKPFASFPTYNHMWQLRHFISHKFDCTVP